MVNKDRGCRKIVGKLVIAGFFLLTAGLFGNSASAGVTGECDNCHTMHASQDGLDNTEVQVGAAAFASWSGGVLAGGDVHAPQARLLKTNCVGCHSNTGPETIVTIGSTRVPIVYNTGGYPTGLPGAADHPLAGGNFAGVTANHSWGHNVGGISPRDSVLTEAPGGGGTCSSTSCHANLAEPDATTPEFFYNSSSQGTFNGCKGCHNKVAHHDLADTSYRYLGGHGNPMDKVDGGASGPNNEYEDPDWEQSNSSIKHNKYKSQTDPYVADSIGRFCAGCHGAFHSMGAQPFDPIFGEANGGDFNTEFPEGKIVANSTPVNPWMRHPTNVNIPNDGEYAALYGQPYSPLIPVAQAHGGNWDIINFGDQVMCLSCHRAHASDQPDALRFEYSAISAHTSSGSTAGCFYCHRSKDD